MIIARRYNTQVPVASTHATDSSATLDGESRRRPQRWMAVQESGRENMAQFKNFINGKWVDAAEGGEFERRNPATGEVVGTFAKSRRKDVNSAIQAAHDAFQK